MGRRYVPEDFKRRANDRGPAPPGIAGRPRRFRADLRNALALVRKDMSDPGSNGARERVAIAEKRSERLPGGEGKPTSELAGFPEARLLRGAGPISSSGSRGSSLRHSAPTAAPGRTRRSS